MPWTGWKSGRSRDCCGSGAERVGMEIGRISAIVLTGGFSSRMGRDKAELPFGDVSMLRFQIDRLRRLGIGDVIVSGRSGEAECARFVPDRIPHRGPLSGIHACLLEARGEAALVIAVDAPVVPESLLRELIARHESGVTLPVCEGRRQPMPGVYDRALAGLCGELLLGEDTSVRRLLRETTVREVAYTGDPRLLSGCNTPEEYAEVLRLAHELR